MLGSLSFSFYKLVGLTHCSDRALLAGGRESGPLCPGRLMNCWDQMAMWQVIKTGTPTPAKVKGTNTWRVMKPLTRAFCLEGSGDPLGVPVPVTVSLLALRSQVRIQSESVTLSGQSSDASRVSQSKAPLPCACCPPHILCFISNRPFISLFIVVAECSDFFASTHSSIV